MKGTFLIQVLHGKIAADSGTVYPVVGTALVLMSALLAVPVAAQTGSITDPQGPTPFVDSVRVEVVNLDVVVTDRSGNPVTGLTRDDFQLFENGEPVEISNFFAVTGGAGLQQDAAVEGDEEELQLPALPENQQRFLVVFVDDSSLQPAGRRHALAALWEFLEPRLRGGWRVMMVRHSDTLQVVTDLTWDPGQVTAGLEQLRSAATGGSAQFAEWKRIVRELQLASRLGELDQDYLEALRNEIRNYAKALRHSNVVKLRLLSGFIDSLSGLPGRKAVAFVSDGLALRPGESLIKLLAIVDRNPRMNTLFAASKYSIERELRMLTDHANASRVTFYTINGGGWTKNGLAERNVELPGSVNEVAYLADTNHSEPLVMMAESTGGRAVRTAKAEALSEIARDLDSYYSLGFVPPESRSNRRNRLEVKVARENLQVRYRRSYRLRPPEAIEAQDTQAALYLAPSDNPLGLRIEVGTEAQAKGRRFLVPVTLRIPTSRVAFIPQEDTWNASLTIHLTASDGGVEHLAPVSETLPVAIPDDIYRAGGVPEIVYDAVLLLRKGSTRIAVSVHDELGAQESTVAERIVVAASGEVSTERLTDAGAAPVADWALAGTASGR